MSKYTYNDFEKNYRPTRNLNKTIHGIYFLWNTKEDYLNYLFSKLGFKKRFKSKNLLISNPFTPLDLFDWSIGVMKNKYK